MHIKQQPQPKSIHASDTFSVPATTRSQHAASWKPQGRGHSPQSPWRTLGMLRKQREQSFEKLFLSEAFPHTSCQNAELSSMSIILPPCFSETHAMACAKRERIARVHALTLGLIGSRMNYNTLLLPHRLRTISPYGILARPSTRREIAYLPPPTCRFPASRHCSQQYTAKKPSPKA